MASIASRLAEAVSCQLNKDFCCNRGQLFGEKYLDHIVGDVLTSLIQDRRAQVMGEYPIPHPESTIKRSGRPPTVDFVLKDLQSGNIILAVESKWAGSSHASSARILQDLLRLADLASTGAKAIFLIAGTSKDLKNVLGKSPFALRNEAPVISLSHGQIRKTSLVGKGGAPCKLVRNALRDWRSPTIPKHFRTVRIEPFFWGKANGRFGALAWNIYDVSKKRVPLNLAT